MDVARAHVLAECPEAFAANVSSNVRNPLRAPDSSVLQPGDLPVLNASRASRAAHPAWHDYFRAVYGHDVDGRVDLNGFDFFFAGAPLHLAGKRPFLVSDYRSVRDGLIYYLEVGILSDFGTHGWLVHRAEPPLATLRWSMPRRVGLLEVTHHACPGEADDMWFFPARGTGVFLNITARLRDSGAFTAQWPSDPSFFRNSTRRRLWQERMLIGYHMLPEFLLKGFSSGRTACGSEDVQALLRAGYGGRAPCRCSPGSLLINCGSQIANSSLARRPSPRKAMKSFFTIHRRYLPGGTNFC